MIYFDYSATTPVHPDVAKSIYDVMTRYYGNPSSLHGLGLEAEQLVSRAREQIAELLQVSKSSSIIFTSGGSESNNMAIKGSAGMFQGRGKHIITSAIEHPSVYDTVMQMKRYGYEVTVVDVDQNGRVRPDQIRQAIRPDTVLVSIMMVNNEIGTIEPIQEISQLLASYPKVLFHVDAIQAVGKIPVLPEKLGVDLLSISAHKCHGPKGIGILYKRDGVNLDPLISGGGQEYGLRSGTENVPLIVGMAKALRLSIEAQQDGRQRVSKLRKRLLSKLAELPDISVNSPLEEELAVPHIINLSCVGMKSEVIVHALEQRGCSISSRSACSSKENTPSRVLLALGHSEQRASSGLRISLSAEHTERDIDQLSEALRAAVMEMKQILR